MLHFLYHIVFILSFFSISLCFFLFLSVFVHLLSPSLPTLKKPCCRFKCCLEMFPGAFTRGNSVAFSLVEACWYCSWPCPHCSLTTSNHTHKHTPSPLNTLLWLPCHMLPFIRHFEYMVPPCHHGKIHHCTVFHLSLSLTLPLIWTRLIFTAASLLRPSCFKAEGV